MKTDKEHLELAQSCKDYYSNDDFKGIYWDSLLQDTSAVQQRIIEFAKEWRFEKYYGTNLDLTSEQAKQVYDYILEDIDSFVKDYHSYYVGGTSLDSANFGEQEEQLKDFEGYDLPKLKEAFESVDYFINDDNSAYFDLSANGVHVEFLNEKIPMLEELVNEKIKSNN